MSKSPRRWANTNGVAPIRELVVFFVIEIPGLAPEALFFHPLHGFHFRTFAFCGALVFRDRVRLGQQPRAKRAEHAQQQIELFQTLTPRAHRAEKELELNPSTTIGNRQHVMAPLVLTTAARFDFRENVRSVTG
jgi:hypothetical protein